MLNSTAARNLPLVIQTIGEKKLEGVLICSPDRFKFVQLFFRNGDFIHATGDEAEQPVDEVLHQLLGWPEFRLEWQRLQVRLARPNISEDTRTTFLDIVQILLSSGTFNSPAASQLEENFFETAAAPIRPEPIEAGLITSNSSLEVRSRPIIESNLLLPPGVHQNQLQELLAEVSLPEQIEALTRAHFTGYVYYRLQSSVGLVGRGDFGLLLLQDGKVTDMLYSNGTTGQRQIGMQAFKLLTSLKPIPEIYKVEKRILKAYRGLIACDKPQRNIKGNQENFARIMEAFKQARRDGVVQFYVDKLKLHYFFFFENGLQVGVFGPDTKSGHLQPLAAPLALPANDGSATITVMLASQHIALSSQPPVPVPLEPEPFEGIGSVLPGAVDWDRPMTKFNSNSQRHQPKRADVTTGGSDLNPFDF